MKKLLLILLCLPMIGFGQPTVNIPDANFKAYLVGEPSINTNGDSEIQVSEATAFNGTVNCNQMNIADLTGIGAFTALTELICWGNQLTSLDVSNNTALTYLDCAPAGIFNQLTSLDISNNINLNTLICPNNQISSLDVSQNTALTSLSCSNNQLDSLDVSNNTNLGWLDCNNNQLTSLDVRNGNNTNLIYFNGTSNPNLTCINVDDVFYSTTIWANIDPQHYFSTNCPPSAIQELTINKELLKITDLLGRETKQTNQPLFYIYDDGTVEKRIVIEQ
jgi:hypothetical protein